jgi:hypothetical protein
MPVSPAPVHLVRPLVALASVLPLLALLPFGLAAGCGGSTSSVGDDGGGGAPDSGSGVSPDQAANDAANVYCARVQACAPAYLTLGYGDLATCEASFKAQLLSSFGAPGSSTTTSQIEACVAVFPQTACSDLLSGKSPTACLTMPGQLAGGAACAVDAQCAATHCRVSPGALCGTCAAQAAAGGSCGVTGDCQPGLTCQSGACIAYGDESATCSATQPCRPDLGCVGGTCGTPSAVGTKCASSAECGQLNGDFCNPVSLVCQQVSFVQAGAQCGLVSNQLVLCMGPGGYCEGDSVAPYVGTCEAHANDWASCDADAGPLCDEVSVCAAGTCQVPDPASCK